MAPRLIPILAAALLSASLAAAERVPWTTSRIHGSPEPPPPYRVERAFPKLTFNNPLDVITIPGTNRFIVIEQRAKLLSLPNDEATETPDLFADLKQFWPEATECYGIAFHPRFPAERSAFVWINLDLKGQPNREDGTLIVRFRITDENPPKLDPASGRKIFSWTGGGHNGGNLKFGPDGFLYFSTGDAASPDPPDVLGTGQDLSDALSSVLRIDIDREENSSPYAIPRDNPFIATPGARGEVWAYGFRNPWRLSFDSKTGALWVGEVGWELWESIVRVERGGNYGWGITEAGRQDVRPDRPRGPTPILPPAAVHSHEEAASITGGEVYHGARLPELDGAYIYGDWQLGTFWALRPPAAGQATFPKPVELCRSTLMPAGFGFTPDGELLICDHTGGGLWRLAPNTGANDPAKFPRRLSETGLFTELVGQQPAPGVVHYSINAERFADHATSERWIGLPAIDPVALAKKEQGVLAKGRWTFPADTVFAKTYSLEMERGQPASRRRLETQLLHFDGSQWAAYSYRWNDAQTEADLVPATGADTTLEVKDPAAPGGVRHQSWRFYSRTECLRCHNLFNNFIPGYNALQLDRTTSAAKGNQLDLMAALGLAIPDPILVDPHGPAGTPETRARSYLHANCSTCHRYNGGGSVPSLMGIETPLADARLIGQKPVQGDLGLPEGRIIAGGDPARSVLLYRLTTGGRGHMPYLGSKLVDDRGILVVRDWIESIRRERDLPEAITKQRDTERRALQQLKSGDPAPLTTLLESPSGALSVALALIDRSLPDTLREKIIAAGSALADPLRRDLFERFLPEDQRRKVLGLTFDPGAILSRRGDPARGKALFTALCSACHRTRDLGTDFAPDLTHIATRYPRSQLLEQIIHPAKIIDPQWHLTTVILKDQTSLAGFTSSSSSSSSSSSITLKLPGGLTRTLQKSEITSSNTQRISLMPESLLAGLTPQEAADLLDFLLPQ